ncbi:putative methylase [Toxoplasma gondii GAB2-2007-GAL-DOM2]|uniref:Methylase n=11 Tax=Toxoplasma gondii TaxID=5811 RepID=A0A125YVR3_TOXGV|nr:putative methylase [Toxoplasma gondii GT1]ESS32995.1 putative methylase [Toxoplasma gondii VEG]KAF4642939.1 putative methylase [Toxoplasma gondii]KFG41016.1 putative methylase [Toxoplasma gondii GAB2-2007-GAL-DOM2]KFG45657.1 putative methylase [Toxoplasma gondii p89]KFH11731.1 putative methylase [Toxoplasma gondii MAS]PUA89499.1 putative methylase [Toxoplasma gondii TgCATBr9]
MSSLDFLCHSSLDSQPLPLRDTMVADPCAGAPVGGSKTERSEASVSDLAANMIGDVLPEKNFYDSDIVASFTLTPEEVKAAHALVEANDQLLPQFTLDKLDRDAVRNWDVFYKHNQDNFFKDRLWIKKEFPEFAFSCPDPQIGDTKDAKPPLLVDVGCGVGNALVPILRSFPHLHAVGFDCSKRAVQLLKERWAARVEALPRRGCHRGQEASGETVCGSSVCSVYPPSSASSSASSSAPASLRPSSRSQASATPTSCASRDEFRNPLLEESPVESVEPREASAPPVSEVEETEACCSGEDCSEKEENDVERDGDSDEEEEDVDSWEKRKEQEAKRLREVTTFDITESDVPASLAAPASADYLLLLFVLSALHPRHHITVARRCARLLKPGGILFFRDYGRYDLAQLRFAKRGKSKVADNTYVRHDGTLACYFLTDELREIFCREAGLEEVENRYCLREFTNRKTGVKMRRIWIQAKFRRPLQP